MAKFSYKNMMHSTTQQTPIFANHSLHPRFNIQGVNNAVNLVIEDRIAWLTDIQTQLVSNLEEAQR
jgi:gluconate kinase